MFWVLALASRWGLALGLQRVLVLVARDAGCTRRWRGAHDPAVGYREVCSVGASALCQPGVKWHLPLLRKVAVMSRTSPIGHNCSLGYALWLGCVHTSLARK